MLATYNDNLNTTTSLYNSAVGPYKPRTASESVYGGTKSLYNGPVYEGNGRRTPGGLDTKSMYGGLIEEAEDRRLPMGQRTSHSQLKRSASVHSRIARRNPQDLLPDEPSSRTRAAQQLTEQLAQQQKQHQRQLSQLTDKADRVEGYTSDQMYRY